MAFFSNSLAYDFDTDTATWLPGSVAVPPATISSESCVLVLTPHRGPLVRRWRSFELAWREISTRSRLLLDKERPRLLLLESAALGSENLDIPFLLGSFSAARVHLFFGHFLIAPALSIAFLDLPLPFFLLRLADGRFRSYPRSWVPYLRPRLWPEPASEKT